MTFRAPPCICMYILYTTGMACLKIKLLTLAHSKNRANQFPVFTFLFVFLYEINISISDFEISLMNQRFVYIPMHSFTGDRKKKLDRSLMEQHLSMVCFYENIRGKKGRVILLQA